MTLKEATEIAYGPGWKDRVEHAKAQQKRIDELTAEVQKLRAECARQRQLSRLLGGCGWRKS